MAKVSNINKRKAKSIYKYSFAENVENSDNIMKISEFYYGFANYGSYDNIRSLASYLDGLKLTARKAVYVAKKMKVGKILKVSRLASEIGTETEYVHGDNSIEGVIVNLARQYAGANNINLLANKGSFGSMLEPEAAASRYIQSGPTDVLNLIYRKEDDKVLTQLTFEGKDIEYKYLLPTIPMILVNGALGLTLGFGQKILPRNPMDIIKYIKFKLGEVSKEPKILPYFYGWDGRIEHVENNTYKMYGKCELKRKTAYITCLPIGETQKSYNRFLTELEDKKHKKNAKLTSPIVSTYEDLCDTKKDKFNFKVRLSDARHINKLGIDTQITENFTAMDENNKIIIFNSAHALIDKYLEKKIKGLQTRKSLDLSVIKYDLKLLVSKFFFIKSVLDGNIIVNNKKKDEIIKQFAPIDKIITDKDNNFDYLLRMPIYSLTIEKIEELKNQIQTKKKEFKNVHSTTVKDIYLKELGELEVFLKKRGLK